MKLNLVSILSLYILLSGCESRLDSYLYKDTDKDGLSGKVKSVEVYASKNIQIEKPVKQEISKSGWIKVKSLKEYSAIDTTFEIFLSKTTYNQSGNRTENIEYQSDKLLATWQYSLPDYFSDRWFYKSQPLLIDKELFQHIIYNYNKHNILSSTISLDLNEKFISETKYHFYMIKKRIIDSTFFENKGLKNTSIQDLSKYGINKPIWISHKSDYQFDNKNNIIIEGNIHYYYTEYDKLGNWIKLTKYYEGPEKKNPVFIRRAIEYWND